MQDANTQMAAMQAQFEETIAKLHEDFTARLRVLEASNKSMSYSWYGGQRRDDGRDDGMVSRDGDMPRQQQQQQWSRGGGIPHQHQRSSHVFPQARQARQQQPLQQPSRGIPTIGGRGEDGSTPLSESFFAGDGGTVEEWLQSGNMEMPMFSLSEGPQQSTPTAVALAATAPAAEAVTGTSVFPTVSSKGVAETPTSSMGVASAAVPAAAPSTGDTAAHDASMERAARQLTFEESSAGTTSSDAAAEAAPLTGDTAALDASVERVARKLTLKAESSSEICGERGASSTPLIPVQCFHWRFATTKAAGCSIAVAAVVRVTAAAAAATATTTSVTTTHGGMQPVLEPCCDSLIRGNDAGGVLD